MADVTVELDNLDLAGDDKVVPFQVEGLDVRGRAVQVLRRMRRGAARVGEGAARGQVHRVRTVEDGRALHDAREGVRVELGRR